MGKIISFTIVSVDGYFAGPNGEIDWFKNNDEEDRQFSLAQVNSSATLIFGHTTYDLMARYWPTPGAIENDPVMAEVLNTAPKLVFSKTLKPVEDGPVWKNVKVLPEINRSEILGLKERPDRNFAILGSGTIVQQFANLGLIDEYQLLLNPVILGAGKYLFKNVKKLDLKLIDYRTFGNGKIFLKYRPVKNHL